MQQKNSHASLCTVKHHMAPTGQTLQVNFSFRAGKTVAAPRLSEKEKLPGHRSTAETTCLQKMSPRHPQVTEQTGEFFFSKRRALPSGRPSCKRIRPEPLWGETLSLGQSVTLLRQNHSSEAGNVVHPQAVYRELFYSRLSREGVAASAQWPGNWMPPVKQHWFPHT